jgi:hypothetical protein
MKNKRMKRMKYLLLTTLLLIKAGISFGQVNLCDEENSYHPIDYNIFKLRDSLLSKSVDSIIIYSHWISTGLLNGYGKVIWKKDGETFLIRFNFNREKRTVERQQLTKLSNDSMFNFFFENELDTIKTNPTNERQDLLKLRHDGRHFISINWLGNEYCFVISSFLVLSNLETKRVQWINLFFKEESDIYGIDVMKIRN